MEKSGLLSMEALEWLKSIGYSDKSHEERMVLIKAARILYPEEIQWDFPRERDL